MLLISWHHHVSVSKNFIFLLCLCSTMHGTRRKYFHDQLHSAFDESTSSNANSRVPPELRSIIADYWHDIEREETESQFHEFMGHSSSTSLTSSFTRYMRAFLHSPISWDAVWALILADLLCLPFALVDIPGASGFISAFVAWYGISWHMRVLRSAPGVPEYMFMWAVINQGVIQAASLNHLWTYLAVGWISLVREIINCFLATRLILHIFASY